MPEVDSGSGIALLVMGIVYGGGFLVAAWVLVRRLSRQERKFHDQDQSSSSDNANEEET